MITENEKKAIEYFKSKYNQEIDKVKIGNQKYMAQYETILDNGKKGYSLWVKHANGWLPCEDAGFFSRYNEE